MIAMVTSALALTVSGVFFSLYDYQLAHAKAEQEFDVIATILADRSTAALAFYDQELARENLNALNARAAISLGCLYNAEGALFASFDRDSYQSLQCANQLSGNTAYADGRFLEIRQQVILDETVIGTLYLLADQGDLRETVFLHLITSVIIIAITLFILFCWQ